LHFTIVILNAVKDLWLAQEARDEERKILRYAQDDNNVRAKKCPPFPEGILSFSNPQN
jgi:hypothetical protein